MRLLEEELAKHSDALEARTRELKERERAFEEPPGGGGARAGGARGRGAEL